MVQVFLFPTQEEAQRVREPHHLLCLSSAWLQCLLSVPWQGTETSFQKRPQESTGAERSCYSWKKVNPSRTSPLIPQFWNWGIHSSDWQKSMCLYHSKKTPPFSLSLSLASMIGTNCSFFLFASACQQHEESQAITLSLPTFPVNLLYQRANH